MELVNIGGDNSEEFISSLNYLLSKLRGRFPQYMHEDNRLKDIIVQFKGTHFGVVIEPDYVDKQFRDSYYVYFAQKYRAIPRNCLRLSFFEGELNWDSFLINAEELSSRFVGVIVLRPLYLGSIGKTLINPKKIITDARLQTCPFQSNIGGRKISYSAFPFSSQDNETMTCAQTSLYNLINYYGRKYPEYRVLMPNEILSSIENNNYERVLPADGLGDELIAKVLLDTHLYPRLYKRIHTFKEIMHIYVESGIPFILGVPGHAVNCIGRLPINREQAESDMYAHAEEASFTTEESSEERKKVWLLSTAALTEKYIIMDDNRTPYLAESLEELTRYYYSKTENVRNGNSSSVADVEALDELISENDSLIVPLYRRVYIDAKRAKDIFFSDFFRKRDFISSIQDAYEDQEWGSCRENPIVWRIYLTTSKKYRDFRIKNMPSSLTDEEKLCFSTLYIGNVFPHFIWIMELGTIDTFKRKSARIEIMLDASSSPNSESHSILSVAYKEHSLFFPTMKKDQVESELSKLASERIPELKDEDVNKIIEKASPVEKLEKGRDTKQEILEYIVKNKPEILLDIPAKERYLTAAYSRLYNNISFFPGEFAEFDNLEG